MTKRDILNKMTNSELAVILSQNQCKHCAFSSPTGEKDSNGNELLGCNMSTYRLRGKDGCEKGTELWLETEVKD